MLAAHRRDRAPGPTAGGLVTAQDFDGLPVDGCLARARRQTVAVSGRRPVRTYWGALGFLQRAGARAYPTDRMGWLCFPRTSSGLGKREFHRPDG